MQGRGPISFFCIWLSSCASIIFWKGNSFHVEFSWHPCQKLTINTGVYFWILILFHWFISLFLHHTVFDYCSFVVKFSNWEMWVLQFPLLFLKIILAITGPLYFFMNFKISLSTSAKKKKKANRGFGRDCMESADQFEEYCHLNNIVFQFMNI